MTFAFPPIKDIIKNNKVLFDSYRAGYFYYRIYLEGIGWCKFPVPQNDIGDATLQAEDKAIIFMRYIRKALEEGTFVRTL